MVIQNKKYTKLNYHKRGDCDYCSVCIATYKRPILLEKLLKSLEGQLLPEKVRLEIIVVDNDKEKSAEPIVKEFKDSPIMTFLYFNQPKKSISITRNVAVNQASGKYILFIDDDEVASPKWIYYLLDTIKFYKSDGVFGPVIPEFGKDTPEWIKRSDFFYSTITDTGTKATHKWTSNCIVSAKLLKQMKEPFDKRYGVTGGEDTHLFDRLERGGAKFVYSREAWVSEFLPSSRTRLSYLFLRGMKGGNTHTRRVIEFSEGKHHIIRLFMVIKALTYGAISIALIIFFFFDCVRRTKWIIRLASNYGRLLAAFGWYNQSYR
jgi:succinoglycan biosynthesis protein ExoM